MEHTGKTILNYFKVIKRSSTNDNIEYSLIEQQNGLSINKIRKRPSNYFDGCIVIDDDDENIQKIEEKQR